MTVGDEGRTSPSWLFQRRITTVALRIRGSSEDSVSLASPRHHQHQLQHVGLKFGNLHKCSFRFKRWKQSWFVLEWRELIYYDDEQFDQPKVISLNHQISVIEADINETKRPFSFKLAVQRRTYVLAAESRASMEEWIYALRSVSGLYQAPPPTVNSPTTPSDQAVQIIQYVENILSVCTKLVGQAANAPVPGVCDQAKLSVITTAAIKCAASARVVAYRPNMQSALQQLITSLNEICDHSKKYSEFLKIAITTNKKDGLDTLVGTTESLAAVSREMLERCTEPEPPTEQETVLLASRNAATASSNVYASAREKDVNRLVDASKSLVQTVNALYETTKAVVEKTGHEHPKTLAHTTIDLARDLIAKAKDFHLSKRKDEENEASLAVQRLQEQLSAVVISVQSAGQHQILEQQLQEAVLTIQNAASDIHAVAHRRSRNLSSSSEDPHQKGAASAYGDPTSQAGAVQALKVIEAARAVATAVNILPNAIKQCSKTTLFKVAKQIGTATNDTVQVAAAFLANFPSPDPIFHSHLTQSIRSMQSSGLQLLAISKVVIQEEFKNQSDLLLLSGVARSHALCVAHILSLLKVHIVPRGSGSFDDRPLSICSNSTSSSTGSDYEISSDGFTSVDLSGGRDSPIFDFRESKSPETSSPLKESKSPENSSHLNPASNKGSPLTSPRSFFTHSALRELPHRASKSARLLQQLLDEEHNAQEEEINIWNEPPDSENNIIMGVGEDGEKYIRAATLNKLIIKLTNENDHDIKFQKMFILTYRSFTTPNRLFNKLMQRYLKYNVVIPKLPPAITPQEYRKRSVLPIQLRVINVLKMWIETAFYDMNDDLVKRLRHFVENVLVTDGHNSLATQVGSIIDKQIKARNSFDHPQFEVGNTHAEHTSSSAMGLEEHSEEVIAQQLTIVDFELYTTIKPAEVLNQAWNKEAFKHRAPNVLAMIARFNAISMWAASIILWKQTIKERVALWTKLVSITEYLLKLNNFNTALAIISGLNSAATFRLKFTRAELPKKTQMQFDTAMQLMNSEQSYKTYRDTLHNANPPCVPYLGMYLTDVTFIEDGNKDFIHTLINFRKRQLVSEVVSEIQLYQQVPYDLPRNDKLLSLFHNLPSSTEEQLYQISLLREPRNAERSDIL